MGSNRKRYLAADLPASSSKRTRPSDSPQSHKQGRLDPTFGQRSALPGLDDENESEDVEYTDMDALAYLRSVRQEATRIPTVLTAPQPFSSRAIYSDGTGDSRGWYGDGAYTGAASPLSESSTSSSPSGTDAQSAYFASIVSRLQVLRTKLSACAGTSGAVQVAPTAASHAAWRWKLRNRDPEMREVAGMEKGSVLRVLKMVGTGSGWLGRGRQVDVRTSAWVWSLLGRLPDVGELGSEEVGVVRELGKRAVWVGVGFREGGWDGEEVEREVWGDENDGEDELDDEGEIHGEAADPHVPEVDAEAQSERDMETIRARLLARLESGDGANNETETAAAPTKITEQDVRQPTKNTRATLDMIITIAGEAYGQRDLLEFREVWG